MAGKATFRHPREPRVYWQEAYPVRSAPALSEALGRPLTDDEIKRIGERLCDWDHSGRYARDTARPADIEATLQALATLPGDPGDEWNKADPTTRAYLTLAYSRLIDAGTPPAPTFGDGLRRAAALALELFEEERTGKAGRRVTWLTGVAIEIVHLWDELRGPPDSGSASGKNATPLNTFARILFIELRQNKSASQVAKLLATARRFPRIPRAN